MTKLGNTKIDLDDLMDEVDLNKDGQIDIEGADTGRRGGRTGRTPGKRGRRRGGGRGEGGPWGGTKGKSCGRFREVPGETWENVREDSKNTEVLVEGPRREKIWRRRRGAKRRDQPRVQGRVAQIRTSGGDPG